MNNIQDGSLPLISKEEAQNLLKPHVETFWEIMIAVWKAWEGIPDAQRMMMTPTARANNLYSFMVYYARELLANVKGVTILDKRLFLVGIEGRILLRFKKLKSLEDKRSRNYPTLFQRKYSTQQLLPGMPPEAARLTMGYVLNITQTAIQGVFVTYPNGVELYWDFEIDRPQDNVISMPKPDQRQPKSPRNVKAKNVQNKKKSEEQK